MGGAPGHVTTIGERQAAKTAGAATGNAFFVGFTERGPSDDFIFARSLAHAAEVIGDRTGVATAMWDALDTFFREGGSVAYIGRVVGPAPVVAAHTYAAATGDAFTAIATSSGSWANGISLTVDATGPNFTVALSYNGDLVATSPVLADVAALVAWAAAAVPNYITITDEGGGDPVDATAALTGGTDDHTAATDATRQAAIDLFPKDLGPGQVLAPGITTANAHAQLLAHAEANNRRALLDLDDTADVATLTTATTALRGQANHSERYAAAFAPQVEVPGLTPGTTRLVAASAYQAGKIAEAESLGHPANVAAAGKRGQARFATGLSQPAWSDADRATLNDAGVNVIRLISNVVTTYGNRSLVNPATDPDWKSFSSSRQVMAVAAAADEVMADYDFEQVDGKGTIFKKLLGDLSGRACMPFFLAGALYGEVPDDAFSVNTGPDVNTPTTIANEEIHAQVSIRVSPTGEFLTVEIVKVPTTEAI